MILETKCRRPTKCKACVEWLLLGLQSHQSTFAEQTVQILQIWSFLKHDRVKLSS